MKLSALSALFLLSVLAACSSQTQQTTEPTPVSQVAPVAPSPLASPAATQTFQFPQPSCGDKPTGGQDTWYPVFINGGDVGKLRTQFCADSITTTRQDTGVRSVQLASFTSRQKADAFAQAVGGEVGAPTTATELIGAVKPQPSSKTAENTATQGNEIEFRQSGRLTSQTPGSPINVRDDASTQATARHVGYAGDSVAIQSKKQGSDGSIWYRVSFTSQAQGWVRSDFILLNTSQAETQRSSEPSLDSTTYAAPSYSSSGSGRCNSPDDLDSRGRRCGGRASSVRPGGRN
ncbi:SH3 domain-containing protein [Phormidium tenue FACHB-886]|nr:SH3 domain-containing protein [Phormidium tenue FACHB-886]